MRTLRGKWAKREEVDVNTISEWVKAVRAFIRSRIHELKVSMKTNIPCVFKDPEVTKCLKSLHDKYVIVPTDKAPNNFVFVCKDYYHQCLVN